MKVYDRIKDMLCDELEEVSKQKELTSSGLEMIDTAVDILKDLSVLHAMEKEYPENEYSNNGGYSQGYYQRMPYYIYDDPGMGSSYARGRDANTGRTSMARYDDGGYSRDTKAELEKLMRNAESDREREAIMEALNHMKH